MSNASARNQSALSAASPSKVFFGFFAPNKPPAFFFGVVALVFFFVDELAVVDFLAVDLDAAFSLVATLLPRTLLRVPCEFLSLVSSSKRLRQLISNPF